ncbi:unnamed protein product, partial [marine sediment metagenome]
LSHQIIEIIDFNDIQVFADAANYPCILVIKKEKPNNLFTYNIVEGITSTFYLSKQIVINQNSLTNEAWILVDIKEQKVLDKLMYSNQKLED